MNIGSDDIASCDTDSKPDRENPHLLKGVEATRQREGSSDANRTTGFAVRRRVRDYGIGTVGTLGWTGGSGAQWWVDRQEGIVAVLVTPFAPPPYWPVHNAFEKLMYAAIAESRASSE